MRSFLGISHLKNTYYCIKYWEVVAIRTRRNYSIVLHKKKVLQLPVAHRYDEFEHYTSISN